LVELHVSVEVPPPATSVGFAVKVAVGTVTATEATAAALVPPGPVQANEKEEFAVRAPVLCVPLVGNSPLQPPVAVHPVALVELHVSVEVPPPATSTRSAVNAAVGTILTVTAAA
jgi:hypothetical protein